MFKQIYRKLPYISITYRALRQKYYGYRFPGSIRYWECRYAKGGNSGNGSYGKLAEFKALVLNSFVEKLKIKSVIELGCGDGNQLALLNFPQYIGLDVSKTAIKFCKEKFSQDKTKTFLLYEPECFNGKNLQFKAELSLSLDVIYHLIDDHLFHLYMTHLFNSAERYVTIYSSNNDGMSNAMPHVKHRYFSPWIRSNMPEWQFFRKIKNKYPLEEGFQSGSFANFYFFKKRDRVHKREK